MSYLQYIGTGIIPGIPAKDMTKEQAEQHGGEKRLIATGLWLRNKPIAKAVEKKDVKNG